MGAPSPLLGGVRAMTSWKLRPYAIAGTMGAVPLSTVSTGFSKVGLSLLVLPWKALPMALLLAPIVWIFPAAYRMFFLYTFFPEVVLHDFFFMHYLALFTIPLIP